RASSSASRNAGNDGRRIVTRYALSAALSAIATMIPTMDHAIAVAPRKRPYVRCWRHAQTAFDRWHISTLLGHSNSPPLAAYQSFACATRVFERPPARLAALI